MSNVPPPPMFTPGANPNIQPPQPEAGISTVPEDVNPGTFEDLHKKTKEIFPQPFEGVRLMVNKGLSNHFQISHTVVLSNLQPSGYKFGSTYVGGHQFGPNESFPIITGEMDLSGNFNGQVIHQFTKNLRGRFMSQAQNHKWMATQFSADYRGYDYTGSFTCANVNPVTDSGLVILQYLQRLSKKFAGGAELVYQRDQNIPGKQAAIFSLGGRYVDGKHVVSTTLSPFVLALKLCYYNKASENLQLGVELDGSLMTQECTTTFGYQYEVPKADAIFKAQLDSNFCVSATMEKKLLPLPFVFSLSAFLNQMKGAYRFGIGMTIG